MTYTEHNLPFSELSDQRFEQLCFALLEAEGHRGVRHWGAAGSEGGCDVVSTDENGGLWVTQAKRTQRFGPKAAVEELVKVLADPPEPEPAVYLLAATCALSRATERALKKTIKDRCKKWRIICWGRTELDAKVRAHPAVHGRFFGEPPQSRPPLDGPQIAISKLPVTGEHFVARENHLARLDAAWDDPATHVISFVAFGGVGKSALVNEWLDRLAADGWRGAERVLGWSFYSQGTEATGASNEAFTEYALKWLGFEGEPITSPWEKGAELARLVRTRRAAQGGAPARGPWALLGNPPG